MYITSAELAKFVRQQRRVKEVTMQQIADKHGTSRQWIHEIETSRRDTPNLNKRRIQLLGELRPDLVVDGPVYVLRKKSSGDRVNKDSILPSTKVDSQPITGMPDYAIVRLDKQIKNVVDNLMRTENISRESALILLLRRGASVSNEEAQRAEPAGLL